MNVCKRLLLVLAALVFACQGVGFADPIVGTRWTPFSLPDAHDVIRSWKPGGVSVFSFCALWCSTWKTQVARLALAKQELDGIPIDFITISIDGRWTQVDHNNSGLPLWIDPGGEWAHRQGVSQVPTTVVLDAKGVIRFVQRGVSRTEDVVAAVQKAETEAPVSRTVYMTFDDFPAKSGNRRLLNLLYANRVRATIFCVGDHMRAHLSVLKLALAYGDRLESHSWSHDIRSPKLERCWKEFYKDLGIEPTLYRPPGTERCLGWPDSRPVDDPYDFQRPAPSELIRRVVSAAADHVIIQLHAGVVPTLKALPTVIANLRSRGFKFGLLGIPNPTKPTHPPASWTQPVSHP